MNRNPEGDDNLLVKLSSGYSSADRRLIKKALSIPIENLETKPIRPKGAQVALILCELGVDGKTIIAALLSDPRLRDQISETDIKNTYGEPIAKLVKNVNWLNTFNVYSPEIISKPEQAEMLRRMLLAMIDDVRAVLIKLAFRVQRLRILPQEGYEVRLYISRETLDVYSPDRKSVV